MREETGLVTFRGKPMTLLGERISIGQKAPGFNVIDNGLNPVDLSHFSGKPLIIASLISLDTSV